MTPDDATSEVSRMGQIMPADRQRSLLARVNAVRRFFASSRVPLDNESEMVSGASNADTGGCSVALSGSSPFCRRNEI